MESNPNSQFQIPVGEHNPALSEVYEEIQVAYQRIENGEIRPTYSFGPEKLADPVLKDIEKYTKLFAQLRSEKVSEIQKSKIALIRLALRDATGIKSSAVLTENDHRQLESEHGAKVFGETREEGEDIALHFDYNEVEKNCECIFHQQTSDQKGNILTKRTLRYKIIPAVGVLRTNDNVFLDNELPKFKKIAARYFEIVSEELYPGVYSPNNIIQLTSDAMDFADQIDERFAA